MFDSIRMKYWVFYRCFRGVPCRSQIKYFIDNGLINNVSDNLQDMCYNYGIFKIGVFEIAYTIGTTGERVRQLLNKAARVGENMYKAKKIVKKMRRECERY